MKKKIKITKIYDFLNKSAYAIRQKGDYGQEGLMVQLDKLNAKDKGFVVEVIKMIEFNKTLNNYKLTLKQTPDTISPYLTYNSGSIDPVERFYNLEWRVEIVLSSISMKKVLKPMILFVFHTKTAKKSFYVELAQFQEIRKNFALILRQIHQIEFKTT